METRTARKITIESNKLVNKNISVKVGTIENRHNPETIYIEFSFWVNPKKEFQNILPITLKKKLERELKDIYTNQLEDILSENEVFPKYKDNIFIVNTPENINYNNKKNFVSLELYLHTLNLVSTDKKYPLTKKESKIFNEALKIIKEMENTDILQGKSYFEITKAK